MALWLPDILLTSNVVHLYLEGVRLCFSGTGAEQSGEGEKVFSNKKEKSHTCNFYHSDLSKATPPVVPTCFV